MSTERIKVGVIINTTHVPAWIYRLLETINSTSYLELSTIIIIAPSTRPRLSIGNYLLTRWQQFDSRRLKPKANAPQSISTFRNVITFQKITAQMEGDSFYFKNADCEKVKSYKLNVLVNLNEWRPQGELLEVASSGLWHYFYGDYEYRRNSLPPGYRELLSKTGYMGTFLLRLLKEPHEHQVLYKSYSYADTVSLSRCLQFSQWKAISLVMRKLKDLHKLGPEEFTAQIDAENSNLIFFYHPDSSKIDHSSLRITLIQIKRNLFQKIRKMFISENWILLFSHEVNPSTNLSKYQKIIPPKDRFWADPFIYYKDEKHYIFIEEVIIKKKKGHISVIEIDKSGSYKQPVKVLERPYHLSYPYLREWKGVLYMMPESSQNQTIDVYKCLRFPDKWEFHKTLMDGVQATDATFYYYDKRWWLFVNIREYSGYPNWDELYLFYADEPLSSSWTPHPTNPIVSDVRCARPAGKIFEWKGKIYRPSQNCSNRYGYGLKFNQILSLTESSYKEIEVSAVEPFWEDKIKAVHTFNFDHGLSVLDAKLRRYKI